MAKTFIAEIVPGQDVESAFLVTEKQLRTARNGTPFLTLKLVDKSGHITGRIWDDAEAWARSVNPGTVVLVRARSELYRDEVQLQIQGISVLSGDDIDRRDFLPVSPGNVEDLFQKMRDLALTVKKGALLRLVKHILGDTHLMDRFKAAPAAKSMHHAYLGGLLEHTAAVMELASLIAAYYPELNRDLLVVGAMLHDIGKVDEFVYDVCIDYSHSGRLVGHMVLGVQILDEKIRSLRAFPEEERILLSHLILSHHGEEAMGAVRLPMTREALVLHFADDLDAKMNSVGRILADPGSGSETWSAYQPLFERFFFRGFPVAEMGRAAPAQDSGREQGIQLGLWAHKKSTVGGEST